MVEDLDTHVLLEIPGVIRVPGTQATRPSLGRRSPASVRARKKTDVHGAVLRITARTEGFGFLVITPEATSADISLKRNYYILRYTIY